MRKVQTTMIQISHFSDWINNYYSKKKPFPPFQAEQFFEALPSSAKFLGSLLLLDRFHSILNTKRDLREKIAEKKENKEKLRSTKCTRKLTSAAAAAKITAWRREGCSDILKVGPWGLFRFGEGSAETYFVNIYLCIYLFIYFLFFSARPWGVCNPFKRR